MTPSNSSWSGRISRTKESLDEGYTLKACKDYVDLDIEDYKRANGRNPQAMYCYYDSTAFYILFW